jgi:hypothetical protein
VRGRVLQYRGSARCDKCTEIPLEKHEIFYHCARCKFDACRACALEQTNLLGKETRVFQHKCLLKRSPANRQPNWFCKIENCCAGIEEEGQGRFTQSWRCEDCDFDVCLKCCVKYAEVDVEKLKKYQREEDYLMLVQWVKDEEVSVFCASKLEVFAPEFEGDTAHARMVLKS